MYAIRSYYEVGSQVHAIHESEGGTDVDAIEETVLVGSAAPYNLWLFDWQSDESDDCYFGLREHLQGARAATQASGNTGQLSHSVPGYRC